MIDIWTVQAQARRLDEVAAAAPDSEAASLRGALDSALGYGGRPLQTGLFVWGPPSWGGVGGEPGALDLYSYGRPLTIQVRDGRAGEMSPEIKLRLPWLCSEAAAATAPATVRLGAHRGLFAGAPRICQHVAMRAPGLHFVRSDKSARPSYRVDLVPDYGRSLRFTVTRGTVTGPVIEYRGTFGKPPASFTDTADLTASMAAAMQAAAFDWLPGTRDAVARRWGWETAADAAGALSETILSLRGADREQALPELDRRLWRVESYPDMLVRAVHAGAAAALAVLGRAPAAAFTDDRAAATLTRHIRSEVNDLIRGRGRYAGTTAPLAGINILERLEQSRQVTFIGPGGFSTRTATRGRLDLRSLPENWRGLLCPVQTPESQKVGLIRHLALGYPPLGDVPSGGPSAADQGAAGGPEELSAAVSLIPFLNHNDPTRSSIGSKMFKQALIPVGAHPPGIRTGFESVIAAAAVTVAPVHGEVVRVGQDSLTLMDSGGTKYEVPLVEAGPWPAPPRRLTLKPGITEGLYLGEGDVIAAPEGVDLGGAEPELALGVDALTAVLPWHGYNFEDAIVVSESFAARMMTHEYVQVVRSVPEGYGPVRRLVPDTVQDMPDVHTGQPLLDLVPDTGATTEHPVMTLCSPAEGQLHVWEDPAEPGAAEYVHQRSTHAGHTEVLFWIRVARPLAVGDKLTNRYSGKGVISLILPESHMPRPAAPIGGEASCAEIIINPLGILRRQNFGAVLELNLSVARMASGETGPVIADRRTDVRSLENDLQDAGYPGGRVRLADGSGGPLGPAEGSLFGRMNIMKLVHTAHSRASGHSDSHASPVTGQPVRNKTFGTDRWRGAAQRIGEMEMWALSAVGAADTLADIFTNRGSGDKELRGPGFLPAGLRSTAAHLRLAGIHLVAQSGGADGSVPAYTDVSEDDGSARPGPVTAFHLGWSGTDEPALRPQSDVFAALGNGDGEPQKSPAFAKDVIDHMYRATLPGAEPDAGSGTRAAHARDSLYMIELGTPVPHPWAKDRRRDDQAPDLPDISCLPVPPASMLAGDDDILLARLQGILYADIQYRAQAAWDKKTTGSPGEDTRYWYGELSERVAAYLGAVQDPAPGSVAARLSGKKGLLRHNLLGSSVIRSGRAVIVPDPVRHIETIGIPSWLARDLGVGGDGLSFGDVVLFNRQPTLHPYSVVALRAEKVEGDALRIHPYLCKAIAGDFDGDTAAVHRPATVQARAEAWRLFRPAVNLRNSGSGDPLAYLDLDVALGLLLATGTPEERQALSKLTGLPLSARLTPALLSELALQISTDGIRGAEAGEAALKAFHRLMGAGFEHAQGWGFSLSDLPRLSPDFLPVEGGISAAALPERIAIYLQGVFDGTQDGTAPVRRVAEAYVSGAGGKDADMARLLLDHTRAPGASGEARGAGDDGENFNILDGIPDENYFAAAQRSIVKIAEKKLLSPEAGSLTKDLVESAFELMITSEECAATGPGTGPLTCLDGDGLCARCYGPDPRNGVLHPPGSRIGVLAGMLIGEKSTQLSMKSIHRRGTGGGQVASGVAQLRAALLGGSFAPHLNHEKLPGGPEVTDPQLWSMGSLKGLREHGCAVAPEGDLEPLVRSCAPHLQTLSDCVGKILRSVDTRHAQVILRLQYFRMLRHATGPVLPGTPLGRAAERGQIPPLIPHVRSGARTASGGWDFTAFAAPQERARVNLMTGQLHA